VLRVNSSSVLGFGSVTTDMIENGTIKLEDLEAALQQLLTPVGVVSSLPGSPVDGQIINYQNTAMASAGVVWRFRYRAGSSSAYKWEFIGGPPFRAATGGTGNMVAASTWSGISGPSITVPLSGDYTVDHSSRLEGGSSASVNFGISLQIGSTFPQFTVFDAFTAYGYHSPGNTNFNLYSNSVLTNLTASTVLTQVYYHTYSSTQILNQRLSRISLLPIRV
jgi:hypothetical protein